MTLLEEEVYDLIGRSGSLTTSQIAKRFGITDRRARDILRSLESSGRISAKNTVEGKLKPDHGHPKST